MTLLLLWIALIGADRISLLGAHSAFALTPFLALTPIVIVNELWRRHRRRSPITLPEGSLPFMVLALLLLCLCLGSIYVSRDLRSSAPRAVQLALMIGSSFGGLLLTHDRDDVQAIFGRGARLGLVICILFNIAEVLSWLKIFPPQFPAGYGLLRLDPDVYAGVVPRLSGMVVDSNRGGMVMLLFAYLIGSGDDNRSRAWRYLAVATVLILISISRSSILALLGCVALLMIRNRTVRLPRPLIALASLLVAFGAAAVLMAPRAREGFTNSVALLQGRLTLGEGSSQDHVRLLERGFETATSSVGAAVHGIGYGSAHTVLQDFFPGNRYGNFHSVYVSVFAEAGVFAFLVIVVLVGAPLVRAGEYAPLVGGIALFGVFYNALAEPAFWLVLVLGWIGLPEKSSRPKPMANATATARIAPSSS